MWKYKILQRIDDVSEFLGTITMPMTAKITYVNNSVGFIVFYKE